MEYLYGLLLLAPLLLAAITLGIFGWRRVNTRNNKEEKAAPHPFPPIKAWASAEQDKLKLMHSVNQISAQRKLALGTSQEVGDEDHRFEDVEMPDFSGKSQASISTLYQSITDTKRVIGDLS